MSTDLDVPPPRPELPGAVRELLEALRGAGHEAVVVGGCLRDLCLGRRVADWDVATSAPPAVALALFPRAVPIGLRHGTVMVPGPAGPVDVTSYRAPTLAGDLARRDFTINAMAWSLAPERWIDPEGGLADLRARRLRAVGSARDRLREDPLRALRAARLVAELDLALDPDLRSALAETAPRLTDVAAERVRAELERLLAAPQAGRALALLRETGIERALLGAPVAPDAAAVVAALPADPTLRLAAWLRGRDAAALLGRLRFPRQRADDVAALLRHHPVEMGRGPAELGRLFLQLGREPIERLLALRAAELAAGTLPAADAPAAEMRLAALRATLARLSAVGPQRLAVGGAEVMEWLGLAPGPEVGRALRFLALQILEDPRRNEPATLRVLLEAWRRAAQRAD